MDLSLIRPLRHKVLRAQQEFSTTFFEQDNQESAKHFAALDNDKVIGVVSLYEELSPLHESQPAIRLRGMAVDQSHQGQGAGTQLVQHILKYIQPNTLLWCYAREKAKDFYVSQGFLVQGDDFMIEGIGRHYYMVFSR